MAIKMTAFPLWVPGSLETTADLVSKELGLSVLICVQVHWRTDTRDLPLHCLTQKSLREEKPQHGWRLLKPLKKKRPLSRGKMLTEQTVDTTKAREELECEQVWGIRLWKDTAYTEKSTMSWTCPRQNASSLCLIFMLSIIRKSKLR